MEKTMEDIIYECELEILKLFTESGGHLSEDEREAIGDLQLVLKRMIEVDDGIGYFERMKKFVRIHTEESQ